MDDFCRIAKLHGEWYMNDLEERAKNVPAPQPHDCPICGKKNMFHDTFSYDTCDQCGWIDDATEGYDIDWDEYEAFLNAKEFDCDSEYAYYFDQAINNVNAKEAREAWEHGITVPELKEMKKSGINWRDTIQDSSL